MNPKKLYRLYREERLTVRKRGGRKRARWPLGSPQGPHQRWSLDFVSDSLIDGRRFRILCVIDAFSRECLATVVDNSTPGCGTARPHRGSARLALPGGQRQRHGADLACAARMAAGSGSRLDGCRTGASFNGRLRDACLNEHLFQISIGRLEPRRTDPTGVCNPVHTGPYPQQTLLINPGQRGPISRLIR